MRGLLAACVLFISMVCTAYGQGMDMTPPTEMKAVDFLVGTFKGNANMAFGGGQTVVSSCVMKSEKALNDRYVHAMIDYTFPGMTAPMQGMHMLTYDAQAKQYVAYWFDGAASTSMRMAGNFEGDKLVLLGDPVPMMPGGPPTVTRSTWWKTTDGVGFKLEAKNGDKWDTMMDGDFKKQ